MSVLLQLYINSKCDIGLLHGWRHGAFRKIHGNGDTEWQPGRLRGQCNSSFFSTPWL